MRAKKEQSQAINPKPVLSIGKDGTVIYSNEAGEPLLNEWGVEVGERLPSYIGDIIERVLFSNSPKNGG